MKTIWYIAKKDLLLTLKDKSSFFFMLAMPIIFMSVMGLVVGNAFGGSSGPIQVTLALNNQDKGVVGQAILAALKTKNDSFQVTLKQYNDPQQVVNVTGDSKSNVDAGLVIPAKASATLTTDIENHKPINNLVKFYTLPSSNNAPALYAQALVNGVIGDLVTDGYASSAAVGQVEQVCHTPGNTCAPGTINPQAIAQNVVKTLTNTPSSTPVQPLTAGKVVNISGFDIYVPGYAIFFALFGINAVAGSILEEKEEGTFRRLLITPVQKYALLGGKVLAQFILCVLQISILFAFGYIFFHVQLGNLLAVALLILATSFGVTGLGILLVSFVKTRRQLNPVVTLVTLVSSIIGGVFFPSWLEPSWMQQIAKIGLPSWAIEGLNNVMIYGKGLDYVLPDILGLLAYGLICYLIALRFFRFQEKAA